MIPRLRGLQHQFQIAFQLLWIPLVVRIFVLIEPPFVRDPRFVLRKSGKAFEEDRGPVLAEPCCISRITRLGLDRKLEQVLNPLDDGESQ